jgi:aspartate-semialdehyde dehydrogenase
LKEALSESPLAAASFVLLDEDQAQGQLDQVGDEVTFVQAIDATPSSAWTSHFSAAPRPDAQALAAGAARRLDGADLPARWTRRRACWCARPGWAEAAASTCLRRGGSAHPAALALALLLERLQQAAPVRFAAATVLEPASEFGRAAMDELHQQTVSLLSFQGCRAPFTMRRRPTTCLPAWARAPP